MAEAFSPKFSSEFPDDAALQAMTSGVQPMESAQADTTGYTISEEYPEVEVSADGNYRISASYPVKPGGKQPVAVEKFDPAHGLLVGNLRKADSAEWRDAEVDGPGWYFSGTKLRAPDSLSDAVYIKPSAEELTRVIDGKVDREGNVEQYKVVDKDLSDQFANSTGNKASWTNTKEGPKLVRHGDGAVRMDGQNGPVGPEGPGWYLRSQATGKLVKADTWVKDADTIAAREERKRELADIAAKGKAEVEQTLAQSRMRYGAKRGWKTIKSAALEVAKMAPIGDKAKELLSREVEELEAPYRAMDEEYARELRSEGKWGQAYAVEMQDAGGDVLRNIPLAAITAGTGMAVSTGARLAGMTPRAASIVGLAASPVPEAVMEANDAKAANTERFIERGYTLPEARQLAEQSWNKTFATNYLILAPSQFLGAGLTDKAVKDAIKGATKKTKESTLKKIAESAAFGFAADVAEEAAQGSVQEASLSAPDNWAKFASETITGMPKAFMEDGLKSIPSLVLMGGGRALMDRRERIMKGDTGDKGEVVPAKETLKAVQQEVDAMVAAKAQEEEVGAATEQQKPLEAEDAESLKAAVQSMRSQLEESDDPAKGLIADSLQKAEQAIMNGQHQYAGQMLALAANPAYFYGDNAKEGVHALAEATMIMNSGVASKVMQPEEVSFMASAVREARNEINQAVVEHEAAKEALDSMPEGVDIRAIQTAFDAAKSAGLKVDDAAKKKVGDLKAVVGPMLERLQKRAKAISAIGLDSQVNYGDKPISTEEFNLRSTADTEVDFANGMTRDDFRNAIDEVFGEGVTDTLESIGAVSLITREQARAAGWMDTNSARRTKTDNAIGSTTTYVLDSLFNKRRAVAMVLHELGVHAGLRQILGAQGWAKLKRDIADGVYAGNKDIRKAWAESYSTYKKVAKFHPTYKDLQNVRHTDIEGLLEIDVFMEEVVAQIANAYTYSNKSYVSKIVNGLINSAKRWLRENFGIKGEITTDEILYLIDGATRGVIKHAQDVYGKQTAETAKQEPRPTDGAQEAVEPNSFEDVRFPGPDGPKTVRLDESNDPTGRLREAFRAGKALYNELRRSKNRGGVEGHAKDGDYFNQFKKDLATGMVADKPFTPEHAEKLFGDKREWFVRSASEYKQADEAARAKSAAPTKQQQKAVEQTETQPKATPKPQAQEKAAVAVGEASAKALDPEADEAIKKPGYADDLVEVIKGETDPSANFSSKQQFSRVTHTFANLAHFALASEKFRGLAKSLRAYDATINATKMKFAPIMEDILKVAANRVENQRLGFLLGFSTIQYGNRGIELPDSMIKSLFPTIKQETIDTYHKAKALGDIAKHEILKSTAFLHAKVKAKVLANPNLTAETKAEKIIELDKAMKRMEDTYGSKLFYWPLNRYGRYKWTIRDERGKVVGSFMTEHDGKRGKEELDQQIEFATLSDSNFEDAYRNGRTTIQKTDTADNGDWATGQAGFSIDDAMFDYYTAAGKIDPEVAEAIKLDVLSARFEDMVKQHGIKRGGIPGWSTDAAKVAHTYVHAVAGSVANNIHSMELDEQLQKFSQKELGTKGYDRQNFVTAKELIDHAKNPPNHAVVNRVLQYGFLKQIALRPSFYVAQQAQQIQSIMPMLSMFFGATKAAVALVKANALAWSIIGAKKADRFEGMSAKEVDKLVDEKVKPSMFNGDKDAAGAVKHVIKKAIESGSLQAAPSFGLEEGPLHKAMNAYTKYAGVFALKGEQVNRLATLIAWTALNAKEGRIELADSTGWQQTMDKSSGSEGFRNKVYETAEIINSDVNYIRGRGNQPKFLRQHGFLGAWLSAAMNYKNFGIQSLFQFHAMGLLKARKEATKLKKTLAYIKPQLVNMGVMALLAGPRGYIWFKLIEAIIPDELLLPIYDSISKKAKELMAEGARAFGSSKDSADRLASRLHYSVTNGAPNLLGMDLHNMFQQDLIDLSGNDMKDHIYRNALGASFGMAANEVQAVVDALSGKIDAEEAVKKVAITPFAKGPLEAVKGKAAAGKVAVDLSAMERVARALSIQPTRLGQIRAEVEEGFKIYGIKQEKEAYLKLLVDRSIRENRGAVDAATRQKVSREVTDFNIKYRDLLSENAQKPISLKRVLGRAKAIRKGASTIYQRADVDEVTNE